jgi:hypothetical protein
MIKVKAKNKNKYKNKVSANRIDKFRTNIYLNNNK